MTTATFTILKIEVAQGDRKPIKEIWSGSDRSAAWHEYATICLHEALRLKDEDEPCIYQLIEKEDTGFLFVRAGFQADGRPLAPPGHFGVGMDMPRLQRQQAIELMQTLLMYFTNAFGIEPSHTIFMAAEEKELNWLEWFQKIYLQRPNIFL